MASKATAQKTHSVKLPPRSKVKRNCSSSNSKTTNEQSGYQKSGSGIPHAPKHSFIPENEIKAMFEFGSNENDNVVTANGSQMDANNNEFYTSQEKLHTAGRVMIDIYNVYMNQKAAFDNLEGSKLVEDVLLKGKYWRDLISEAERTKDYIHIYGIKIVLKNPSSIDVSKKRFFACLHLHNAIHSFGIRSALAVHIDIRNIKHKKVAKLSRKMLQLVGDGYNFFALQFKFEQTSDFGKSFFNEPGAFAIYIGFAFILDYVAYINCCKKSRRPIQYDIKQYVEFCGHDGFIIKGIDKSSGKVDFEYEISHDEEDLSLKYVEHLFNGVRFL